MLAETNKTGKARLQPRGQTAHTASRQVRMTMIIMTTIILVNSISNSMHCRLQYCTADLHGPDLEHVLFGAFEVLESPLIHSAVHASRHKLGVIRQPCQAPHLSIMAPVLKTHLHEYSLDIYE